MLKRHLLAFLLFSCFTNISMLTAQCPPPGYPDLGGSCVTSPVFCEQLDGYCNTLGTDNIQQVFPGCPGNILNNDDWFSFYADSTFMFLEILPSNCVGLNGQFGMQAAIYADSCGGAPIAVQCECTTDPIIFISNDFEIGHQYFVVVDGCAGDICDYKITVLSGPNDTSPPPPVPTVEGPTTVCYLGENTYSLGGADSLYWSVEGLTPGVEFEVTGANPGNEISLSWTYWGSVEICATAYNICQNDSATTCTTVEILQPDTPHVVEYEICPGECIECAGDTICAPGIYTFHLTASTGCDSVVNCVVSELPVTTPTNLGEVTLCWPEGLDVCGGTYDQTGTYEVTCQAINGCDSTIIFDLAVLEPQANVQFPPPLLPGGTVQLDGLASALSSPVPNALVTIAWTGPGIVGPNDEPVVTVDQPGGYCLTITHSRDGIECSDVNCVEVELGSACPVDLGPDVVRCAGDSVRLEVAGTIGVYQWNTGDTTAGIFVFQTGNYSVTVTDSTGCVGVDSVVVNIEELPNVDLGIDTAFCEGGQLVLDAGPLHQFLWSTGDTTQSIVVDEGGQYSVSVSSMSGCTGTGIVQVIENENPVLLLPEMHVLCFGSTVELDAGPGHTSYQWTSGDSTQVITVAVPGTYGVTVANQFGCTASGLTDVLTSPILSNLLPPDLSFCEGGTAVLPAAPGFAHYLWNTGDTTEAILVEMTGNYSVTVTDQNGCTQDDQTFVEVFENPVFDLGPDRSICPGDTVVLDAGPDHSNYNWSTGEETQTIQVTEAGTYSVWETTPEGCYGSDEIEITLLAAPTIDLGPDTFICHYDLPYSLSVGGGFSSYLWQDGSTGEVFTLTDPVFYELSLTVVDSFGCSVSDAVSIDVVICDAVFEKQLKGDLLLHPNPAGGFTNLVFEGFENGAYQIDLLDVLGKKWKNAGVLISGQKQSVRLELEGLASGVYFVKVHNEKGASVARLVVD